MHLFSCSYETLTYFYGQVLFWNKYPSIHNIGILEKGTSI
jgi:hypothetical protein